MALGRTKLFTVSIKNEAEFQRSIRDAIAITKDLSPAFKLIAKDFYRSEKAIFRLKSAGGYPDFQGKKIKDIRASKKGSRWDNYTPYQKLKEQKYGYKKGYPLLKLTGALEASVTNPDDGHAILEIGKTSLIIGTSIPYAVFHNSDKLPRTKIPMRKFLFIAPETRTADPQLNGRLARWRGILEMYVFRSLGGVLPTKEKPANV